MRGGGLRECEHLINLTISRESGDPLKKDTSTFFITYIESVYLILVYVKIQFKYNHLHDNLHD